MDDAQPGDQATTVSHAGRARRDTIRDSIVATGRGDDGSTGLLYGGPRIQKDDPRTEAYGTVDEAVAALGLARAELRALSAIGPVTTGLDALERLILRTQRELFVVGAELAANPAAWERLADGETRVSEAMLLSLEADLAELESGISMPTEFIIPGESRLSAALELARTVTRRAERRAITLRREGLVAGEWLVPYLNRLADLLWVMARVAEVREEQQATLARARPRPPRSRPGERPR